MARPSREEQVKENRPNRVPVNEANRNKLVVKGLDRENYYYRWVSDREDRIAIFTQAGYEFVDKNGNPIGDGGVDNTAGPSSKYSKNVGGGLVQYLMRIPLELHKQDQERKQRELLEVEADMKRNAAKNADYGRLESGSKVSVL